jgi:hypothetical protein
VRLAGFRDRGAGRGLRLLRGAREVGATDGDLLDLGVGIRLGACRTGGRDCVWGLRQAAAQAALRLYPAAGPRRRGHGGCRLQRRGLWGRDGGPLRRARLAASFGRPGRGGPSPRGRGSRLPHPRALRSCRQHRRLPQRGVLSPGARALEVGMGARARREIPLADGGHRPVRHHASRRASRPRADSSPSTPIGRKCFQASTRARRTTLTPGARNS